MKKVNLNLYRCRGYLHIDRQVSIDKVKNYIINPEKIAHHSFLPFLSYNKVSEKFVFKNNPVFPVPSFFVL